MTTLLSQPLKRELRQIEVLRGDWESEASGGGGGSYGANLPTHNNNNNNNNNNNA
jgi:hypothetical protein